MRFEIDWVYGLLLQGNLRMAIEYIGQFPEEADRLSRYTELFEKEKLMTYPVPEKLQKILATYQQYFREVFYLGEAPERAAHLLEIRICEALKTKKTLHELEKTDLPRIFEKEGLHFMGGRTGGFYGPHIWRTSQETDYQVELPGGIQVYRVRIHRDFLIKGWLDYLSFGQISTGGWTDQEGSLNCIGDCYDFESEAFRVSLLKHEAQHTQDLQKYPGLGQEELEYRAKLVELIYSRERNLLSDFRREAGNTNGHTRAARRIAQEFPENKSPEEVRSFAWDLLKKDDEQLEQMKKKAMQQHQVL